MYKTKVGDEVLINLPKDEMMPENMLKFHGATATVDKIRKIKRANITESYFELSGAVSDKGIPYGFMKEWLLPTSTKVLKL